MADYAISNVPRRVVYAASGVGPYAFTFEILANTDIAVYRDDTLLTLTTDYSVTIAGNGTGSITLTATPTGATQIAIVGDRTIQRTSDFVTSGDFFAATLNQELDSQTIFAQQNAEAVERALKAPQTDPTTINMTLPRAADRAGKYLAFDEDGNPVPGDTSVSVTAVAAIADQINAVAAIDTEVVTVASNISSINSASANAAAAASAKTAAETAQAAAEAARDQTLTAFDNFDDRYLGTKTSNPTLDNDGNALVAGALYFNSVAGEMRVYTGSAWVAAYVSGTGFLAAANNLSDVANAATARSNLGLVIGADVQAYDATILKSANIGLTVQGYDAATAKTNVAQNFTVPQRAATLTDNDLSFDLSAKQNFKCTPTAGGTLTFTNPADGLSGFIILVNGSNYAITAAATTKISSAALTRISATGTYRLDYASDGTNTYVTASESLA